MTSAALPISPGRSSSSEVEQPFWPWFLAFLRQEMRPYPGRALMVTRYTLTACLTMLVIMVFRLPGGAIGGFFTLLLPRNSPRMTVLAGITGVLGFALGELYLILGAAICVGYPLAHVLWVAVGLFLAFFALSAIPNPSTAQAFAIVLAIGLPAWDTNGRVDDIVTSNLWTADTAIVAIVMTIVVEYVFHTFSGHDELEDAINGRLEAASQVLAGFSRGEVEPDSLKKLSALAIAGVSSLREALPQKSLQPQELHRLGAIISLTGRLVDLVVVLQEGPSDPATKASAGSLAIQLRTVHFTLNPADQSGPTTASREAISGTLLADVERVIERLRFSFVGVPPFEYPGESSPPPSKSLFKPDAFSSREHVVFGFRGGMAALLCYGVLNVIAYPGLAPALFTCVVTATPSIGTSRQRQFLRICGSLTGGVLLGIGSQVFILPWLDTFTGFLVLFAFATALAAWILTGSPRISYYGTQIALGFYTVQLHGFGPQLDLALARDGVVGILLGLVMMWLMFEKVGGKPALRLMQALLAKSLKGLSQLVILPQVEDESDVVRARTLRGEIAMSLSGIGPQSDAVLFENGGNRRVSLLERQRLLSAEAILQSTLLTQMALLHFRLFHRTVPQQHIALQERTLRTSMSDLLMTLCEQGLARRRVLEHLAAVEASLSSLEEADSMPQANRTDLELERDLALHLRDLAGVLTG